MAEEFPTPSEETLDDVDKLNPDLVEEYGVRTRGEAALALWIEATPLSVIAEKLHYSSTARVRSAVEQVLANTVTHEDKEKMRALMHRRLDRLLRPAMAKATDEDQEDQSVYMRTALAIIDRQIKLHGLDAPSEHVIYNPSAREIEEFLERAAAELRGGQPREVDVIDGEVIDEEEPPE